MYLIYFFIKLFQELINIPHLFLGVVNQRSNNKYHLKSTLQNYKLFLIISNKHTYQKLNWNKHKINI